MDEIKSLSKRRYTLDVRGYTCPYPQYYTIKALHTLRDGETLEVILDNHPSVGIIQATAKERGFEVVSTEEIEKNTWRIIVSKGS
jgi:tRNA 2-thiouridine synthesizing protein A